MKPVSDIIERLDELWHKNAKERQIVMIRTPFLLTKKWLNSA